MAGGGGGTRGPMAGASALHAGFQNGLHAEPGMPPPPPPPPHLMARGPRGRADPWAAEFMQHELHVPPQAR